MSSALLPPNATPLEAALADAMDAALSPPVPIRDLWRPETCPEDHLPYLAWALSVDAWDDAWPATTKRAAIASAIDVHRGKGTAGSMRRALDALGFPDAEIVEGAGAERYDGAFLYDGSETYGTPAHWAEYRVYLSHPVSIAQAAFVRGLLGLLAPARCELAEMSFVAAANLYDAAIAYDGAHTYGVA